MNIQICSFVLALLIFSPHIAHAVTIDYIFNGVGSGTIGDTSFDGNFTVTYFGDTSAVQSGGPNYFSNATIGTFQVGSLTTTFKPGTSIVLTTGADFPSIGFAQSQPAPIYGVNEALISSALETYNLATPFALTSGSVSYIPQTYLTALGDLAFTGPGGISSLSFEAVEPTAVPLPATCSLFGFALLVFSLIGWQRRRQSKIM